MSDTTASQIQLNLHNHRRDPYPGGGGATKENVGGEGYTNIYLIATLKLKTPSSLYIGTLQNQNLKYINLSPLPISSSSSSSRPFTVTFRSE